MELVIIIYVGLLAYILIQMLLGRRIPWNSTGAEDVRAEEIRQEHLPAIKSVLQKESKDMDPKSEETLTLILTEQDSFRKEWEIIADDDAEEPTHPKLPS
jgi:hypothetical protein